MTLKISRLFSIRNVVSAVTCGNRGYRTRKSVRAAKTALTEKKEDCQNASGTCELKSMGEDNSIKTREREKDDLLNNLLNKSTIIITSFSVKFSDISILTTFKEIAKREVGSRGFSEVLIKAMKDYNQRHSLGNPQLLMSHYIKPEEPQPMRVLCLYCQGALTEGKVFCQKKGMWIPSIQCYSCKNNRLRK